MFDMIFEREWANARRTQQPLSLIMLDIDYFKEYNDHYGHIAGDDCLKHVGQVMKAAAVRPRDFIARYGGEEFVLVLPETNMESAKNIAERCRNLVFEEQIPHKNSHVNNVLTISLGVGTIIPTQDDEPIEFIETVDKRLYQAKEKGRNSIVDGS
jgi:diguanylate cyclase (GGDEF)-like protein